MISLMPANYLNTPVKIITLLLLFFLGVNLSATQAQEINGDVIYVNVESEILINFPAKPNSFNTEPTNAPYTLRGEKKSIFIKGRMENSRPAALIVAEGGRTHHFNLQYKKDIDFTDREALVKDYSTLKKLAAHIQATPNVPATRPVDSSSFYYFTYLEKGDNYLKQGNDDSAKASLEKAHSLRPAEILPIQKLEEIKTRLLQKDKLAQQERDRQYITNLAEARVSLDKKRYLQAQDKFKKALENKPGDVYAGQQLEAVNKILINEGDKIKQQENNNLYKQYIAQGEIDINKNLFNEARNDFKQALLIKPEDAFATRRLKVIDDKERQQNESTELENKRQMARQLLMEQEEKERQLLENNYNSTITVADNFFKAADYENAKIEYSRALSFIKKDWPADKTTYPREQISKINKIKTDSIAQANTADRLKAQEAELELKYAALIKNAEAEFNKSNYTKAKALYTEAANLKPLEALPKNRLLIIDNILATIAKDIQEKNDSLLRMKEINAKYNVALSNAKSAYAKNDLPNAKLFYEEAKNLKPDESEAVNKLKVINDELERQAQETELNNKYDALIDLAIGQLNAKQYDIALKSYTSASLLKPLEVYPKKQIRFIQSEMAEIARKKAFDERREVEGKYNNLLSAAEKAVTDKRWEDAKKSFEEALAIHPENTTAATRLKNVLRQVEIKNESDRIEQLKMQAAENEKGKKSKRKKAS